MFNISISNTSAPPILASAPLFSVLTRSSIQVHTSSAFAQLDSPCTDLSVAQGGTLSCSLAFEIPIGDTPDELDYDDHLGHSASAPIPELTIDACTYAKAWTGINTSDCQSCVMNNGCPKVTACTSDEVSCVATQAGASLANICSVATTCSLSQACADAWQAEFQCLVKACDPSCR